MCIHIAPQTALETLLMILFCKLDTWTSIGCGILLAESIINMELLCNTIWKRCVDIEKIMMYFINKLNVLIKGTFDNNIRSRSARVLLRRQIERMEDSHDEHINIYMFAF